MIYIVSIIIVLLGLFVYTFYCGGVKRNLREIFYGKYYAEDGVLDPRDKPNTAESFKKCVQAGVGIKTSIYLSKDKKLVLSSYNDLSKEYGLDKKITESDYSELGDLHLLTLPDLIEIAGGTTPVLAELKVCPDNEVLCRLTADAILASGKLNVGVVSFHPGMMAWFKHTEKSIFRGLISAPAKDFTRLPKAQAFMTGNLFNNSVCKPNVILYRNKPESFFVRFAYSLGVMTGTWTITDRAEGEKLQEKKDIIICRGYMPKEPVFKDLPEIQKTKFEIENEEKMKKKLEYQLAKEKIKEEVRAEKAEKKREKAAESGKPLPDSKAAYFYDEEEFGTPDFNYDENNESNSSDPTEEPTENK